MKKLLLLLTIISHFAFGQNNSPQYNSTAKTTTQSTGVTPKAKGWTLTDTSSGKSPVFKFETGRLKFKSLLVADDTSDFDKILVMKGDSLFQASKSLIGSSAIDTTKVGRIEQGRGTAPIFMYFNGTSWVRNDTSYIPRSGASNITGNLKSNQSSFTVGLSTNNNFITFLNQVNTEIKSASSTSDVRIGAYSTSNGYADISVYNPSGGLYDRRFLVTGTGNNTPDQSFRVQNGLLYYYGDYRSYMTDDKTIPDIGKVKQLISDSLGTAQSTTLADGKIWIGDGTDTAFPRTLSGDVTVDNLGVTSYNGIVPNSKLTDSVSKLLPIVGNIINKSWTDLTGLTKVGTQTFTVSSGNLNVVGGTPSSIDLSNYYYFSTYGTSQYVNYEFNFGIRVGTISATSHGVAIGKQSSSSYANRSIQIGVLLNSTQKGHVAIFNNNSNTIIKQTVYPISVSSNDSITVVARRIYDQLIVTITNVTVSPNQSTTLSLNKNEYVNNILDNIGYYAIYALGGTHNVGTFPVKINHRKGSDLLVVGDSRTNGIYSQNIKNSFHGILSDEINGTVDYYAGGGNRVSDYNVASVINEFNVLAPKKFLFHMGVNDINDGQTAATTASRLKAITTGLTNYTRGTDIFYTDETPSYVSTGALSTSIKDSLGVAGCIFTNYALMGSTVNKPNMTYYSYDSLHYNNDGHEYLANIILSQFQKIGLSLKNRPFTNTSQPYFQNGKMSISSGVNTVPTQSLEIRNRSNTSHILLSNSETSKVGGALGTVGTNSITAFGGCYYDGVAGATTAMDTTGSFMNLSTGAEFQFSTFTGGTVGSPITANRRMTITKSGNVGIGTSTPTYQLHITGDAIIGNKYAILDDNPFSLSFKNTTSGEGMGLRVIANDNDGTDNVTVSYEALGVPGATNRETGTFGYFAATTDFQFFSSASGTGTARPLRFGIGINPTAIYINSSSNVGIGTTTPNSNTKLDVNGLLKYGVYTVSTLPTCNAGTANTYATVTDALTPTYLTPVVGGGAIAAPVFCNSSQWVTH